MASIDAQCPKYSCCEVGGQSATLGLPWFGDPEQRLPNAFRVILYTIALVWLFLGVALISDVFMGAIERITSRRKRVWNKAAKRHVTQFVWNPTVANLTLMALGSSAPEILLSVIELFSRDFYAGDLGPSTIVGSAAFNLFVIIAVCIMAIPDGEVRKIKEMPVYCTTAVWSILAYLWLLVILLGNSKNVVEPLEGVLTLLFMPLLVSMAFLADKGYFYKDSEDEEESALDVLGRDMTREELAQTVSRIRASYGDQLTEGQVAKIIAVETAKFTNNMRATYRVGAIRAITGSKRVKVKPHKEEGAPSKGIKVNSFMDPLKDSQPSAGSSADSDRCIFEFPVLSYAVMENAGQKEVHVHRRGNVDRAAHVTYKTRDGTAKAGSDYVHAEGVLSFGPGVTEQSIKVTILDDNAFELDEDFFVDLYEPKVEGEGVLPVLGCTSSVSVVIIEDDLPGELSFTEEQITVHETPSGCEVDITVQRKQGCTGLVSCRCYTQDDTAKAGVDYEGFDTTLQFQEGETAITIQCAIKGRGRYDCREMFRVILEDVEGGASFNASTDGGRDSCVLSVFIEPQGQEANEKVDRIMQKLARKWQKSSLGHSNWKDQFIDALYVNGGCGGKDKEDDPNSRSSTPFGNNTSIMPTTTESSLSTLDEPPGVGDYVMHVISLPWKLLFALVPPPDFCGGWLCFFCSLMMIALVTAVIGDMAAMLGCVLTIPDEITAITFVALGTSLPDTFASRTAAVEDKTADASVGNVTGSNSVNVFLGLGLPWSIGSIYWAVKGSDQIWDAKYKYDPDIQDRFRGGGYFIVKAGTLGFSVAIFSCCALSAIALLYVRRRVVGGELGGPRHLKLASALCLVGLWVFYVALSSWNALQNKQCG